MKRGHGYATDQQTGRALEEAKSLKQKALADRNARVLHLANTGHTTTQIASRMGIASWTVSVILRKYGKRATVDAYATLDW